MLSKNAGQSIRLDGLHFRFFNESGQSTYNIEIQGVGRSRRETPYVKVNGVTLQSSAVTNSTSGLALIVLKDDMTVKSQGVYQNSSTGRTNFVNKIKSLTDEVFVVFSVGSYDSDSGLDELMEDYHAVEFRNSDYNKYDYCYSAIGSGRLKSIVSDRCFFDDESEPLAFLRMTIDSKDQLGNHGYGNYLVEVTDMKTGSNNAAEYIGNFIENQYLLFGMGAKISRSLMLSGSVGTVKVEFYDSNSNLLSTTDITCRSCEVVETMHQYIKVPTGTTRFKVYKDNDGQFNTLWLTIYRAGFFDIKADSKVKMTKFALTNEKLTLSPVSSSPSNPSDWVRLQRSNSNKAANVSMGDGLNEDVQWSNYTLSTNRTRAYSKITGTSGSPVTQTLTSNKINIDSTRIHFISTWLYVIQKHDGKVKFELHCYDDNNNELVSRTLDGQARTIPQVLNSDISNIPIGRWVLVQGWLFPSTMSYQSCKEFMDQNQYFFGYTDKTELNNWSNGYGVKANGNGSSGYTTGFRMDSATDNIALHLTSSDNTGKSEIMWALNTVCPLVDAAIGKRSIYTVNFVEE